MSILAVGSMALDSVETPFGKAERVLGGSATYFGTSASFFTEVKLVAVVGDDFPSEHLEFLESRSIDTRGVTREKGKTFFWRGKYDYNLNEAQTLDTQLNVFASFSPQIPPEYAEPSILFLANIDPELQMNVLKQVKRPGLIALDTMNYWINGSLEPLKQAISQIDLLIINEGEARQLSNQINLVQAARTILGMGIKTLIIKRGEYGVIMFDRTSVFAAPAYPLGSVMDPTGAGDTFAGGFLGYLDNTGNLDEASLRRAVIFGSVMASYNVEDFSLDRLRRLSHKEIQDRFHKFKALTHFEGLE
ncbi:MAG: sugar kinase [Firmicutes bacterium]|nr:sugar kinase [Bacillota bacterium]